MNVNAAPVPSSSWAKSPSTSLERFTRPLRARTWTQYDSPGVSPGWSDEVPGPPANGFGARRLAERSPVGACRRREPAGARLRPEVAVIDAGVVVPDVDLVAGSPRNGIPGDDRQLRLVAGRAVVGIGTRVARVAHVQVLDPRLVQERVVGERLFERRSLVPVSGVAVGVDRAYAPVVGVVRESLLGSEGRRDRPVGRVAADLRVSLGEIGDRVDLDLVLRCTGDRIPRELRNEQLGFGCGVLNVGCRRRRPLPGEGAGLGRLALVPLRVDGGDGPGVRVRGKEERRRSVRRLGLERITVC